MAEVGAKRFQVPRHWTLAQRLAHYSEPGPNGCRLWKAFCRPNGYGQLWWNGRDDLAHRLAWREAHGPIPKGMTVSIRCDVRSCINGEHLYLRTKAGRIADTVSKKRHARGETLSAVVPFGESHLSAKLNIAKVRAIIKAAGSHRDIGRRFGVNHRQVGRIKRGESWRRALLLAS